MRQEDDFNWLFEEPIINFTPLEESTLEEYISYKSLKVGDKVKILDNPLGLVKSEFIGKYGAILGIDPNSNKDYLISVGTRSYWWNINAISPVIEVGDKVKIKSLEWYEQNKNEFGDVDVPGNFVKGMEAHCGTIKTVKSINRNTGLSYDIHDLGLGWNFTEYMFDFTLKTMENKELKIEIPPGYCIDEENSTFERIKFKPKKLTYKDIAKELFAGKTIYYPSIKGDVEKGYMLESGYRADEAINCTTSKQVEKLLALNKLINVAKYLNGGWEPDFDDDSQKYFLYIHRSGYIGLITKTQSSLGSPCFRSKDLAQQAIEILGERTVKLALSQV